MPPFRSAKDRKKKKKKTRSEYPNRPISLHFSDRPKNDLTIGDSETSDLNNLESTDPSKISNSYRRRKTANARRSGVYST